MKKSEHNIVVIYLLPKQKTRVRFPLLAQILPDLTGML